MKKLIAISVMVALVAGAAFAQAADGIAINAWGRGAFSPLQFSLPEVEEGKAVDDSQAIFYAGKGVNWGDNVRVDFRIVGNSPYVGFGLNATAESNDLAGNDDAAFIWAKPFESDVLKITIGMFVEDELRGKFGGLNNTFHTWICPGIGEEDDLFTRFATGKVGGHLRTTNFEGGLTPENQLGGVLLASRPVPGLFLGMMFDGAMSRNGGAGSSAADVFRFMQLAAGYNIADIGLHLRAQLIGGFAGELSEDDFKDIGNANAGYTEGFKANKPARIEFAAGYDGIDGLLIDFGMKFWMPITNKETKEAYAHDGVQIGLGLHYRMDDFGIYFRTDVKDVGAYENRPEKDENERAVNLDFRLNPYFTLDTFTVGLVFGLNMNTESKDSNGDGEENGSTQFGLGAYIQKGLGKGSIKAGLTYLSETFDNDGKGWGRGSISIPIIMEYAFF